MPDFISAVPVGAQWTNITSASGLNVNKPLRVFNLGIEQIRWAVSASTPTIDEKDGNWLDIGGDLVIPPNTTVWMACVSGSRVSVQYAENFSLESALRSYPALTQPKLQTAIITKTESFALLGVLYRCVIEVDALASGASQWIRFVAPADKEVTIISRNMTSKNSGAEYRLFVGSTGVTAGTAKPAYNANGRTVNPSTSLINLATVTTPGTNLGPILYTGAGASGAGNAQAGTSSRESGFTIYPKGTGFEAKITNLSAASNDIKITLEFAEIPASIAS